MTTAVGAPSADEVSPSGPGQHDPGAGRPGFRALDAVVALALLVLSVGLRAGALAPSSLWLDDAWLALVTRADGLGEVVMVGNTAPGFVAMQALVLGLAGFSELGAQILPFVFGVAAAPALYLMARRRGLSAPAALVGAALVATSPLHVAYSSRVKPYTADALAVIVVLLAGWRTVERPAASRRWLTLGAVSVLAVVISAATAPTVAAAYLAGLVAAGCRRPRTLRPALLSLAGFGAFAAGWWTTVVRPGSTQGLRDYWADSYVDLSAGPVAAGADAASGLGEVLRGFAALPRGLTAVVVVGAAVVVVARRPQVAALVLAPPAVAVTLAALQLAPLGGGRTDIHLYPSLALLVAMALHEIGAGLPRPATGLVTIVAGGALALGVGPTPAYPAQDLRPLVAAVEQQAQPDDAIAVYSASRWAYALYSRGPVDLARDVTSANGFAVVIGDERVEVLEPHRDEPAGHVPAIDRLTAGHDRIWLVSSHEGADLPVIGQLLADRGFVATTTDSRPGASLVLWSRAR